jgi:hypothetical protein
LVVGEPVVIVGEPVETVDPAAVAVVMVVLVTAERVEPAQAVKEATVELRMRQVQAEPVAAVLERLEQTLQITDLVETVELASIL